MPDVIDPVIPFGRYSGQKLSQVEAGYLTWLIGREKATGQPFISYGRNWSQAAELELDRRRSGLPLPEEMSPEKEVDPLTPAEALITKSGYTLLPTALNSASLHIWDLFMVRLDQSKGFYDWLTETTREAIFQGKKVAEETIHGGFIRRQYTYAGVRYTVDSPAVPGVAPRTLLVAVGPDKDQDN